MLERRYLSIAECAEVLGVSERLVYELVARGEFPAVALGRRKVVPLRALELLEEHALEGFEPAQVLTTLAGAAGSVPESAGLNRLSTGAGEETGPTRSAEVVPLAR